MDKSQNQIDLPFHGAKIIPENVLACKSRLSVNICNKFVIGLFYQDVKKGQNLISFLFKVKQSDGWEEFRWEKNGHPEAVINIVITKKMNQFHRPTQLGPKKCPVYLYLPWLGNVLMRYQMKIIAAIKHCYFAVEPRIVHHQAFSACSPEECTTCFTSKQHCLSISVPL